MLTGKPSAPMSENEFYEKLSKVNEYIKPIVGSSSKTPNKDCTNLRNPTVWDAIKAGLLVPTQNFVKELGPAIVQGKDEKGQTAAHWACLGGHCEVLRYLIELGAPINDQADAEPQQLPIHWACTNGHIAIVDILLQHGVSIDAVDNKQCTPLIVAAQYGHTMLSGYLMGKGARLQLTDIHGDNALHWAGFKGHEELMRLLIYSGFSSRLKDDYGQTALHLASLSGSLNAVKLLCDQESVEVDLSDKNGKTPYMLAVGRKYNDIASYLKKRADHKQSVLQKFDFKALVFGPEGNSKYPMLFFLFIMMFWAYPLYLVKCLYNTWDDLWTHHIIFWVTNCVMWVCLYHANTINPGFLPRNVSEYDIAIKQIAHFSEWKGTEHPLSRLCHTCRLVKPERSKHCKTCNRCVDHFDHHCPWIYNCVGYRNRPWFCSFVGMVSFNYLYALYFFTLIYSSDGLTFIVVASTPIMMLGFIMSVTLFIFTIYQMLTNLTTNEGVNWKRYKYLHDANGAFKNPYNRGYVKNVLEYFHYLPPQRLLNLEHVAVA
ncbi:uncharacterized protein [Watersipora subatra]|uniref:uncharacterized protein n=1 Tax=Watersipora subatra TaxID=2589382 RepID=UPI00355C4EE2